MEALWQNIKRSISRAYKSIRHDWKQYLSFFIAIFLTQSFFWLLILTQNAQAAGLAANANKNYDYHFAVSGLTQNQAVQLQNSAMTVFTDDKIFDVIRVTPVTNSYGGTSYTADVFILGDAIERRAETVERRYLAPLARDSAAVRITPSPLLTHTAEIRALTLPYVVITLLFSIVAVLVLMLLYNIRINHFKFLYGIYMTFGADYRKLLFTAAWELITVSLLTLGPALLFAAAVRLIFVLVLGGSFAVSLWTIPLVFLLNLIVIFAAVALPMRLVSIRMPNTLLAAQDNGNLVSSPRRSRPLFGRPFPLYSEGVTLWRYRRYLLQMLLSSVVFAAISVSVLYVCTMYTDNRDAAPIPYVITGEGTIDDTLTDILLTVDGIERLEYQTNLPTFPAMQDHLLIPSKRVSGLTASRYYVQNKTQGSAASESNDPTHRATYHAAYLPMTEDIIFSLEQKAAASGGSITIEGDLSSVLTQPNTVVLSDSIYNTAHFSYRPGDTVKIARFSSISRPVDQNLTRDKDILRQQLRFYNFDYVEMTVGAVMHGMEADKYLTIGISPAASESLLGITPAVTAISIVTDPDLDADAQAALDREISEIMRIYDDCQLTAVNTYEQSRLEHQVGIAPLLRIVACMILIFFPLVCFFSQFLFYFKRNREFSVMLALGAVMDEIKKIHRIDGVFVAGATFFLTLGTSCLANWLLFSACNDWLPSYGIIESVVRYHFSISPAMLIVSLAISLVGGFLSAEIPYHQFVARQKKLAAQADALDDAR